VLPSRAREIARAVHTSIKRSALGPELRYHGGLRFHGFEPCRGSALLARRHDEGLSMDKLHGQDVKVLAMPDVPQEGSTNLA